MFGVDVVIRPATPTDASSIAAIYNHYILHTIITFEETPVTEEEMLGRMQEVQGEFPWLVHDNDGVVEGYAYAAKWQARSAYRFGAGTTIYLHPDKTGKGLGAPLYSVLLDDLRVRGLHTAIAGIALPNPGSVAIHERMGFTKVAHLREVGWKFNQWIDVGYWQLMLNATS